MGKLQEQLESQIEELPRLLIRDMVKEKLTIHGISDQGLEARLVEHILAADGREFEAHDTDPDIDLVFDSSDLSAIEKQREKTIKKLIRATRSMSANLSKRVLRELRNAWQVAKRDESLPSADISAAIEARWGSQLSDLGLLIELCQNTGSKFHRSYLCEKSGSFRPRSEALAKLHIRGCRIAEEVLLLMAHGFAEGALARWRSLFEITVIATLISDADDSLAERWLAHESIDQKNAMDKQHEYAKTLGLEPAEFPESKRISRDYNSALKRYGDNFKSDYGWAAGQLGFGNRPTFSNLQHQVTQQAEAYFVKLANLAVHGSAIASTGLFHGGDTDPLIPGYRGEQLEIVGANMAQTLVQLSSCLIPVPSDFDNIVELQIMLRLRNDILEGLYQTSSKIEADNQKILAAAFQKSERMQRYGYRKSKPKK